jgi:hypothetical protein
MRTAEDYLHIGKIPGLEPNQQPPVHRSFQPDCFRYVDDLLESRRFLLPADGSYQRLCGPSAIRNHDPSLERLGRMGVPCVAPEWPIWFAIERRDLRSEVVHDHLRRQVLPLGRGTAPLG